MSSGVFGSVRPAQITPSRDVEILYFYRPTRSTEDDDFDGYKTLDASECLITTAMDSSEGGNGINGVYDLRLPLDKFGAKGFYSVYIRPKESRATIIDVNYLATYPDVRGIVLNTQEQGINGISDLTGYRIEFSDGSTRLIKSCNRCEPVSINNGDGRIGTRYNLVDSSSDFVFCTVSPSAAPTFRPNAAPYIGVPGEEVIIANTKFSPKMLEIEMTEHDADTISTMLEGDQVRDKDRAIVTTYNENNEIYHQYDYWTIKNQLGTPLYDVKKSRENIDNTQSYDNIMNL